MPKSTENTVFVRLVPTPSHKVLRHELEDVFSQMGPIKKSSWINTATPRKHQDNDGNNDFSSKGYGFVKYVSQEDAEEATKQLHNSKIQMQGKKFQLKVELASTPTDQNRHKRKKMLTTGKASSGPQTTKQKAQLTKNVQSDEQSESCESVSENQDQSFDSGKGSATDDTSYLKKRSRVIIRNLSFYAKESHIRKVLESKFGPVLDVHVPRVKSNLHLGFCFVTFQQPKDAQKATMAKQLDIQKRTVSIEWSLPKNVHLQQKKEKQKEKQNGEMVDTNVSKDRSKKEDEDMEEQCDNKINEEKDELTSDTSSSNGSEEKDSDDDASDDDDDDEEEEEESRDTRTGAYVEDDSVEKKKTLFLRNLPFDTTRHDLFQLFSRYGYITGIYLVKDKDTGVLKGTAFVTYAKPESALRAVEEQSSTSEKSKSSNPLGFVSQREATTTASSSSDVAKADSIIAIRSLWLRGRQILVDLAVDKETAATFDSSKIHSTGSADRRNMYLQSEARVESSSTDENANNANTWDDLPVQDQRKRQHALKDKTTKLQSPIFFINPYRLSFRNVAKHVDEASLQQLCKQATQLGLENGLVTVKDQIAHWRALGEMSTRDILSRIQEKEAKNEDVIPSWEAKSNIKEYIPSVFIDREMVGGGAKKKSEAPSRGFGFAEFRHHSHALACLRELNNNPAYSKDYAAGGKVAHALKRKTRKLGKRRSGGGSSSHSGGTGNDYIGEDGHVLVPRLIVDFAVENKVKAKKQAENRMHQQANQAKQRLERKEQQKQMDDKKKKKSRGALQRERKRKRRESGEADTGKTLELASAEREKKKQDSIAGRIDNKKRVKMVKPPKKKKKADKEEESFDMLVDSYSSKFEVMAKPKSPREQVKEKRWFE